MNSNNNSHSNLFSSNINKNIYFPKKVKIIHKNNTKLNDNNDKKEIINKKTLLHHLSLNDQELNSLEYKKAIKIDKRTYIQYYWSLIKKNKLSYLHLFHQMIII